jgi:hypothetical protein
MLLQVIQCKPEAGDGSQHLESGIDVTGVAKVTEPWRVGGTLSAEQSRQGMKTPRDEFPLDFTGCKNE